MNPDPPPPSFPLEKFALSNKESFLLNPAATTRAGHMTSASVPNVLISLRQNSEEFKVVANQNQRIKALLHQKEAVFSDQNQHSDQSLVCSVLALQPENQDQTFMTSSLNPSEP